MKNNISARFHNFYKRGTLACSALGLLLLAVPAQATLIVNGEFNGTGVPTADADLTTSNVPNWSTTGGINCFILAGSLTLSNKNLCNDGNNIGLYKLPTGTPPPGNYLMADGDPTYSKAITQTVNGLCVGCTYSLTFYQAAGQQTGFLNSSTDYFAVTLGSTTKDSATMSVAYKGSSPWSEQTLSFTATSVSEVLSFLAVGTTGTPPMLFLGDVNLTETGTPEPSTISLALIGGLLCLPALVRRRKKGA